MKFQSVLKDDLILPPDSFRLCRIAGRVRSTHSSGKENPHIPQISKWIHVALTTGMLPNMFFTGPYHTVVLLLISPTVVPASQISQQISPLFVDPPSSHKSCHKWINKS